MGSSRPEQESALAASALEEPSCYECPKCNLKFKDLQPLLNHVNQCLDREDPIP